MEQNKAIFAAILLSKFFNLFPESVIQIFPGQQATGPPSS
jgi:hypothetical protein